MAKLIIDIPDDEYNNFMFNESLDLDDGFDAIEYICNGTVLDNVTNGDVIKALFPDCKDWKAKIEDDDGEVYEVHFVQLPNSITINKYEESWWNAPYKSQESEG